MNYTRDDLLFKAMNHPIRRAIVAALLHHESSAAVFAAEHDITIRAAIKHLNILEEAGLITRKKISRTVICTLNRERLKDLQDWQDLVEVDWMDAFLL